MPPEMQEDKVTGRLERLVARQARKRHLAPVWAAAAGLAPGMAVLDVGAGTGALTLHYAALVAPGVVIAVDPDADSLAHAQASAAAQGLALDAHIGSAKHLPALAPSPDRIMLTDTLHHADDPLAALRAIRAVMKPDAMLFIAEYDPAGPGLLGAKRAMRIERQRLAAMLRATGFAPGEPADAPDEHYTILARPLG